MKRTHLLGLGLMAGMLALNSGCKSDVGKIADYYEEQAEIMEEYADDPLEGLKELHEHDMDNMPELLEAQANIRVELMGMDSKKDVKERSKEIFEDLEEAVERYQKARKKFRKAIREDKKTRRKAEELEKEFRENLEGKDYKKARDAIRGSIDDDD